MKDLNGCIDCELIIDENPDVSFDSGNEFSDEDFDRNEPPIPGVNRVCKGVYISGAHASLMAASKLKITCVVCAAPELPPPPHFATPISKRVTLPLRDTPDTDIGVYFEKVADLIHNVVDEGGRVLVHCVAGVSRSASLCIAYLIKYHQMTLRDAYYHMKNIRPIIRPNTGFFKQLIKYEQRLYGHSSVKMVYCQVIDRDIPDVYENDYAEMTKYHKRYGHIRT